MVYAMCTPSLNTRKSGPFNTKNMFFTLHSITIQTHVDTTDFVGHGDVARGSLTSLRDGPCFLLRQQRCCFAKQEWSMFICFHS